MPRWEHRTYLDLIRGTRRGPGATLARGLLSVAEAPYRIGASLRNLAFDRGWKAVHRADVPVISVGNLTLGGTGKTPMVEWLARTLRGRDLRVVLLSRGYRAEQGLNDEGRVLDQNLPDVPHLQDADRVTLARIAVEELEAEVLVLDDGFQHRRLARDLDIVLLDALDPFGLGRLTPRGLLREPVSSLRRAGVVVLSRADLIDADARRAIRREAERRARHALPWAEARHAPRDLIDHVGNAIPLVALAGQRVFAFCGIGNPDGFRRTLESIEVSPIGFHAFDDHHGYTRADVLHLADEATELGAQIVLTTQKDLVKLRTSTLAAIPLRALRIGLDFLDGEDVVVDALRRVVPSREGESRES